MLLKKFIVGPIRTNMYLLVDEESHDAVVIDPAGEPEKIIDELAENKAELKYILITHAHPDHIASCAILKDMTGASVAVGLNDAPNLGADFTNYTRRHEEIIIPCQADILLKDKQILSVGSLKIKVISSPGHSQGSVCFYLPSEKLLFSGDTIFADGLYGRTDLEGSNDKAITQSIKKILTLPPKTKILPGHGYESTVEKELQFFSLLYQ